MNGKKSVVGKAPQEETNKMFLSVKNKNIALKLLYTMGATQESTIQGISEYPWVICKCPWTRTRLRRKRKEDFPH